MLGPLALILTRVVRPLAVILAAVAAAGLWLVAASALWSKGTGTPFAPLRLVGCDAMVAGQLVGESMAGAGRGGADDVPGDAAVRAISGLAPALTAAGAG